MKKLLDSIKNKFFLTTLILLGSFVFFSFVYLIWEEARWSGFELSSWIMFTINAGLVALIIVGLTTNKKEFIVVPFTVLGIATLYNLINATSGISSFFDNIDHIGSNIRNYKSLGYNVRVNVPTLLGELMYGFIGLGATAGFVCLMLGKVVLKKEKVTKIANIIISLISVAFVVLGIIAVISSICDEAFAHVNNVMILCGSYSADYIIYALARASLWAILALVSVIGLPTKPSKEEKVENTETTEEAKAE